MRKNIKLIIIVLIALTVIDILISIIGLKIFPVTSIVTSGAIIYLLIKYGRDSSKVDSYNQLAVMNENEEGNKMHIGKTAFLLIIPFIILAIGGTYLMYLYM